MFTGFDKIFYIGKTYINMHIQNFPTIILTEILFNAKLTAYGSALLYNIKKGGVSYVI